MKAPAGGAVLLLSLLVAVAATASGPPPPPPPPQAENGPAPTPTAVPALRFLLDRVLLLFGPHNPPPLPVLDVPESGRLFHHSGDPDSLFTLGGPTEGGDLGLRAAFEVNDVVIRALAPDFRVSPSDTRQRAAGDYSALDIYGRPYQLRLGARLIW